MATYPGGFAFQFTLGSSDLHGMTPLHSFPCSDFQEPLEGDLVLQKGEFLFQEFQVPKMEVPNLMFGYFRGGFSLT